MKSFLKVTIAIGVFAIGVASTLLLLWLYNPKILYEPKTHVLHQAVEKKSPAPGLPVRLKIPKINVDAAIEGLGLTPQGDLAAPEAPEKAGWYSAGPRPGEPGSAVIDGHFGRANNEPAVFDQLHNLQKGDRLHVIDAKGATHSFVVNELRSFKPDDDARVVFRSSDGKAHLNLITCQGLWDKHKESYSLRLVVFASILE